MCCFKNGKEKKKQVEVTQVPSLQQLDPSRVRMHVTTFKVQPESPRSLSFASPLSSITSIMTSSINGLLSASDNIKYRLRSYTTTEQNSRVGTASQSLIHNA
jgi:hypothetical protein